MTDADETADDVFDRPCLWRDEAITALGLTGEAVMAGVSPGAAFPSALRSIVASLPADVETLVDLGAGAGGATEWLRRQLGANVIAIEPATGARDVARQRFPDLDVRDGRADRTGLADGTADVVVLLGVLSLMDDLSCVLDEVSRVLRRPGYVAIADLFPVAAAGFAAGPNSFRSFEGLRHTLEDAGYRLVEVGCGQADPDPTWAAVAGQVSSWIESQCADRPGFAEWCADQAHLRRQIAAGQLLGGCVVASNVAVA